MYKNNSFNPKNFTKEIELTFEITRLTFKINSNVDQYHYQNKLLKDGRVPAHKYQEFSDRVNGLGMEIQKDKRQLVELGKAMAELSHNIDPRKYCAKF